MTLIYEVEDDNLYGFTFWWGLQSPDNPEWVASIDSGDIYVVVPENMNPHIVSMGHGYAQEKSSLPFNWEWCL